MDRARRRSGRAADALPRPEPRRERVRPVDRGGAARARRRELVRRFTRRNRTHLAARNGRHRLDIAAPVPPRGPERRHDRARRPSARADGPVRAARRGGDGRAGAGGAQRDAAGANGAQGELSASVRALARRRTAGVCRPLRKRPPRRLGRPRPLRDGDGDGQVDGQPRRARGRRRPSARTGTRVAPVRHRPRHRRSARALPARARRAPERGRFPRRRRSLLGAAQRAHAASDHCGRSGGRASDLRAACRPRRRSALVPHRSRSGTGPSALRRRPADRRGAVRAARRRGRPATAPGALDRRGVAALSARRP